MKTITIQQGTKQEILDYLRKKSKGVYTGLPFDDVADGESYEKKDYSYEYQINQFLLSGSPLVSVSVPTRKGRFIESTRYQFVIDDYAEVRCDLEISKLDSEGEYTRKINEKFMHLRYDQ